MSKKKEEESLPVTWLFKQSFLIIKHIHYIQIFLPYTFWWNTTDALISLCPKIPFSIFVFIIQKILKLSHPFMALCSPHQLMFKIYIIYIFLYTYMHIYTPTNTYIFICAWIYAFAFTEPESEMKSLNGVQLFVTPWTVAYQAPQSMGFSRQEYWSGLPFPSPGESSQPGDWTRVSHTAGRRFTIWATREAQRTRNPKVNAALYNCHFYLTPW